MSDRPDPEKIVRALLTDPTFLERQTPKTLAVFEAFARALPELLAEHHDQPLTFTALTAARIDLIRRFAAAGYLAKLVEAMPGELLGSMSVPEALQEYEGQLPYIISRFESDLAQVRAALAERPGFDGRLLENPNGGRLNVVAMEAYRTGTLTVGRLLEIQPSAVFTQA